MLDVAAHVENVALATQAMERLVAEDASVDTVRRDSHAVVISKWRVTGRGAKGIKAVWCVDSRVCYGNDVLTSSRENVTRMATFFLRLRYDNE